MSRQWQCRARHFHFAGWPFFKGDTADQAEMRDAMRCFDGDGLRDASSDIMADQAGAVDTEQIQKNEESIRVRFNIKRQCARRVTSSIAEQVQDDDASSFGEQGDQILPEVRGRWEAVYEHQRLTASARSRGEVVESGAADVEKFAAH